MSTDLPVINGILAGVGIRAPLKNEICAAPEFVPTAWPKLYRLHGQVHNIAYRGHFARDKGLAVARADHQSKMPRQPAHSLAQVFERWEEILRVLPRRKL